MTKTYTQAELNEAIRLGTDLGRKEYNWTDEDCMRFAANLMENLDKAGFKIVEG